MAPNLENREAVAKAIAGVALLRGTFTLRSGRTSSYYLDKYLFSTRPEGLRPLGRLFAERIQAFEAAAPRGGVGRRAAGGRGLVLEGATAGGRRARRHPAGDGGEPGDRSALPVRAGQ